MIDLTILKWYLTCLKKHDVLSWAKFVPYESGEENKRACLYKLLENGEEGMVFKNLNSFYLSKERNMKRSGYWYKYKRKDTIDVIITGSKPPEQFYKDISTATYDLSRVTKPWRMGWFGSLNFDFKDEEGNIFSGSCSGMTDEMRSMLSDGNFNVKQEYIGRTIEIEFFERNKYGNCEHPRFIRLREELEK